MEDILGGRYQEMAPRYKAMISEKKKATPADQKQLHKFYRDLLWGLERTDVSNVSGDFFR